MTEQVLPTTKVGTLEQLSDEAKAAVDRARKRSILRIVLAKHSPLFNFPRTQWSLKDQLKAGCAWTPYFFTGAITPSEDAHAKIRMANAGMLAGLGLA